MIFSAIFFFSFFLHLLIFLNPFLLTLVFYLLLWDPFSRSNTNYFPSCSHSNRGCAAEPGGGPADQRLHGNGGSQRCPYLCYPRDAAATNHLEEERHHTELLGPGGYQCECTSLFSSSWMMLGRLQFVDVADDGGAGADGGDGHRI